MAQKADVDEELDRLEAHVGEVRHTLEKGGPCGRRLDFLMQELNREANTLSSKSISSYNHPKRGRAESINRANARANTEYRIRPGHARQLPKQEHNMTSTRNTLHGLGSVRRRQNQPGQCPRSGTARDLRGLCLPHHPHQVRQGEEDGVNYHFVDRARLSVEMLGREPSSSNMPGYLATSMARLGRWVEQQLDARLLMLFLRSTGRGRNRSSA